MTLRATKVTDRDAMREQLVKTNGVYSGRAYYKVSGVQNLEDVEVESVEGLPKERQAWSESLPECVVTSRTSDWWTFPKEGVDGVALVLIQYGVAPEDRFTQRPPEPEKETDQWTEYNIGLESQTIYEGYRDDANGVPFKYPYPINNGQGMNINIGVPELRVVTHLPLNTRSLDVARYLDLSSPPKVNSDARLKLPPLWDTKLQLEFAVGELLYVTHAISRVKEFIQVTHVLRAARDHWVRWQPLDAAGKLIADERMVRVVQPYKGAPFRGLWNA